MDRQQKSSSSIRIPIAEKLHRPVRRDFVRPDVELKGLHNLCQADVMEMICYGKVNKWSKYLIIVINGFSKFAYAVPLKTKMGTSGRSSSAYSRY